ncbi:MAG: Kae1-associated kinase Bud32, partial [Methanobacteriota archaeon]
MLMKRGAEAELRRTEFLGRPAVDKARVPKTYRLKELD